jgi:hypothetical protein
MMNKPAQPPMLALGQVWSFKGEEIAIIGVSKHLAEYRRCRGGKVDRTGLSDLTSIRALQVQLVKGSARLKGHLVLTDRLLQGGASRPTASKSSRKSSRIAAEI